MKNIFKLILVITMGLLVYSCEDFDDPTEGLETGELFVQYAANVLDTLNASEGGDVYTWTVQAPISAGEDLVATVSFSGEAVFETDYTVTAEDDLGNDVLISSSATGASFTIPFTPTGGDDLITDQMNLTLAFPTDDNPDGAKELIVTLDGATSSSGVTFVGGRGPIRRDLVVNIGDIDCGFARGSYDVNGTLLVDDFGSGPYNAVELLASTNCPDGTVYGISDITGGLYTNSYATVYGTSARAAEINIPEAGGVVTWEGVSDQFGGEIIEDPASDTESNYNTTTGVITIYWTATAFGERGITTFTPQ